MENSTPEKDNSETVLINKEQCDRNDTDVNHEDLMDLTTKTLNDILKQDTVLCDLPNDVTLEEVNSQIAVLHGQSMTIYVERDDCEEIPVVVHQKGARVIDLKRSIQRHFTMHLKRKGISIKLSWYYIWKTNNLCYDNVKLKDDKSFLSEFNIRNKSRVKFVKKLRGKGSVNDT